MTKYKLIKEYPGSYSVGTVISFNDSHGGLEIKTPEGKISFTSLSTLAALETLVSNYPEFWEKIIEKDYEILSFYSVGQTIIPMRILNSNTGLFKLNKPKYKNDELTLDYLLKEGSYSIYSIKRLSDGEIFTIGDKITGATYSEPRNIISFRIINNKLRIDQSKGSSNLEDIKKLKNPLFVTEDGVDKYEGEEYYYLHKHSFRIDKAVAHKGFNDVNTTGLYFSTKEKAEEYVLMNKPYLSIDDLLGEYKDLSKDELLKLIKLKYKY